MQRTNPSCPPHCQFYLSQLSHVNFLLLPFLSFWLGLKGKLENIQVSFCPVAVQPFNCSVFRISDRFSGQTE